MGILAEKKALLLKSLKSLIDSKTKELEKLKEEKDSSISYLFCSNKQREKLKSDMQKIAAEIASAKQQIKEIEELKEEEDEPSED